VCRPEECAVRSDFADHEDLSGNVFHPISALQKCVAVHVPDRNENTAAEAVRSASAEGEELASQRHAEVDLLEDLHHGI
jgi:hypothetical protein